SAACSRSGRAGAHRAGSARCSWGVTGTWPDRRHLRPGWYSWGRVTLHSRVSRRKSRCEAGPPPRPGLARAMHPKLLCRTPIKFCRSTRVGDAPMACELGAGASGFVFAEGSPRRVAAEEARAMRQALAPLVDAVALFRDNTV